MTKRILAVLLLAVPGLGRAQSVADYITFDFARNRVDSARVYALSLEDARLVRGLIFGMHGRIFDDDADIKRFLQGRPWYRPNPKFTNAMLNDVERRNLEIVRGAEAAKHEFIQPGDLRYHRDRSITVAMLGKHTPEDWQLLETEIPAAHGAYFPVDEFDDADTSPLQKYYSERYWYRLDSSYRAEQLSDMERAIMDTIRLAHMRDQGLAVAPGLMYLYRNTPMIDSSLRGVRLHDLRILRNEIYARHGRRFTTPWLRDYFTGQSWYKPRPEFDIRELNEVEKANIALITAREAQMHDELSTRRFGNFDFDGLFPEVARRLRNEIFARHGRIFRDAKLQGYFASLPWYKPDSAFTEASLNPIERDNVKTLSAYEIRARQGQRYYPA